MLEVDNRLEADAIAEIAAGDAAFVNDAAGALRFGAGAAGKISRHTQGEGNDFIDFQAQGAAHEKSAA